MALLWPTLSAWLATCAWGGCISSATRSPVLLQVKVQAFHNQTATVTCRCTTPNSGAAGHNQYRCADGTSGYCVATAPCYATGDFPKGQWAKGCGKAPVEATTAVATTKFSAADWQKIMTKPWEESRGDLATFRVGGKDRLGLLLKKTADNSRFMVSEVRAGFLKHCKIMAAMKAGRRFLFIVAAADVTIDSGSGTGTEASRSIRKRAGALDKKLRKDVLDSKAMLRLKTYQWPQDCQGRTGESLKQCELMDKACQIPAPPSPSCQPPFGKNGGFDMKCKTLDWNCNVCMQFCQRKQISKNPAKYTDWVIGSACPAHCAKKYCFKCGGTAYGCCQQTDRSKPSYCVKSVNNIYKNSAKAQGLKT